MLCLVRRGKSISIHIISQLNKINFNLYNNNIKNLYIPQ